MSKLRAFLAAVVCGALASAAPEADHPAPSLFNAETVPGWLSNIAIAGVRTAFPDAQRLYMNTIEGEGSGPVRSTDGKPVALPLDNPVERHNVSAVAFASSTIEVSCRAQVCMWTCLCPACCPGERGGGWLCAGHLAHAPPRPFSIRAAAQRPVWSVRHCDGLPQGRHSPVCREAAWRLPRWGPEPPVGQCEADAPHPGKLAPCYMPAFPHPVKLAPRG